MSLLDRTKSLLRRYRSPPKRAFGQNFIIEPSVYERMISYASLEKHDTVLDIGAGLGVLTRLMADKCSNIFAVEADAQLAGILHEQLAGISNVRVIGGNILEVKIPPFNKIVSTPPYNISSQLLLWILNRKIDRAVLVLQKEFANRLAAHAGSREYGWLAVLAYCHVEVEILDDVSKSMFYPQPKVNSVITRLSPKNLRPCKLRDEADFKKLVQSLFTRRNRKLKGAVLSYLRAVYGLSKENAAKIAETIPFKEKRVRELAPEDFGALANAILR
jgi:16S rRNA (adenine1518-N6/adenine1519-N6)-dimethyltransferase